MSEPFLGEIRMFGFNFAPRGWAFCNGQLLAISQNTALFSLLGTMYGGNGVSTFALPDLRSRIPLHFGTGPGLSNYSIGQQGGVEVVTLLQNNLPPHTHTVACSSDDATTGDPNNAVPSAFTQKIYAATPTPGRVMSGAMITGGGGSIPHENRQPFLCLNFCIALEGIFPSRN